MCTVKPCYILAERLGLFAMRLPSLSRGNGLGLWHNFLCFLPMFCTGLFFLLYFIIYKRKEIHADDLDNGYKVVTSEMEE